MTSDLDVGEIKGSLRLLTTTVNNIEHKLLGNGQPGAMERITRIEENLEKVSETLKANTELACECNKAQTEQISKLASAVSELKDSVEKHHSDTKSHTPIGLLMRKEVIFYSCLIIIILNLVIPANLSLWEFILKLLGI